MRISIAATTISVAAMIVALSFINGFQQVIAEKVFGFWGHVRIQHMEPIRSVLTEDTPITGDTSVINLIGREFKISHISPYANRSAILNANGTLEGILLKGVTPAYAFKKINRFLKKGKWPTLDGPEKSNEIAISSYTATQLKLDTGNHVLIYFIQKDSESPRTRKLRISGIFSTGMDVYDKNYAIGDLRLIQQLNSWTQDQIGGYEIDLKEPETMESVAASAFSFLPQGWNIYTLKELSPEIFDWLNLQNTNKYIMIIIMTIIALINLITCLIILLLERTTMIAVLKSLGMHDTAIQKSFVYYGGWIAVKGIFMGTVLGLGLCYLQQFGGIIRLNEETYYVKEAPVAIDYLQVFMVAGGTLAMSMVMLIMPSVISRKINPVRALRFK